MSLTHLRTFVEVHRQRSISKAARVLGLTQPAVSGHIASLEAQLGRPLFERHARGAVPTAVADDLAASLGQTLDRAEAALSAAKARSARLSGVVHVAGPSDFLTECVAPLLPRLLDSGLELRVQVGGKDMIYGLLLDGQVDLALTASLPEDRRLAHQRVGSEDLVAVAAPVLADRIAEAKDLAVALDAVPHVAYDADRPLLRTWLAANGLPLPGAPAVATAPDLRFLRALVASGAGWTVLPDYLCQGQLDDGRLVEIAPPRQRPSNAFYLAWAKSALRHPRVAFARERLAASLLEGL